MRLTLEFSRRLDVREWERRARAGEVPGLWPYGLHRLADEHAVLVNDRSAVLTRALPGLRGYDVPRLYRRTNGWSDADAVVSWEELTAMTFPLRRRRSGPALCCGVIWSTDIWERHAGRGLETRITKQLLRRMDLLWCLSTVQADELSRQLGAGSVVEPVTFGIDTDFYAEFPPEQGGPPLVVSAGSDRDRDMTTLYAALETVLRAHPGAKAIVQTRAPTSAPTGVQTIPSLTHTALRDLYRRSSLVALALRPNLHVSGMTVALEAMATGRPVICSSTPGMSEYVLDGSTGSLVAPGDPSALARAMIGYLDDDALRKSTGRAAAAHVRLRHRDSQMTERLGRLIAHTVTERRG